MKLWHDNYRYPPAGWDWARTNTEAQQKLQSGQVTHISLDYDMGPQNGNQLVQWMIRENHVPPTVIIHSQNPHGVREMAETLQASGITPQVQPAAQYEGPVLMTGSTAYVPHDA